MLKKFFALTLILCGCLSLRAQKADDPVIFEIGGQPILKSEFMRDFLRSVGQDPNAAPTACTYEKRQALTEYVELFVNFRTKLADAYALRFDTLPSLRKELSGYRNELAQPYLLDSNTLMHILDEAYERNHYVLHAAHILVSVRRNASPADTMAAYQKAMDYYNRAMAGEDFNQLAHEAAVARADAEKLEPNDPRRNDNGDLGNFTVFEMIYPFENAAYSLQAGEISLPIRTVYGYHVVKLIDKVPYFGKATLQHIWCAEHNDEEYAASRVREAYEKLQSGETFISVCRNYSDDQSTSANGGMLNDLSVKQMPIEYVRELSKLQVGEVSKPFHTSYGWHIVRLVQREGLPEFEDMVPYYRQRLVRDQRSQEPTSRFVEQCKTKYHFVDYTTTPVPAPKGKKAPKTVTYMASLDPCMALVDSSVFDRQWHYSDCMNLAPTVLFAFADTQYTAVDFMRYVDANQHAERYQDLYMYMASRYQDYINEQILRYANAHLEEEHPEFKAVVDEYRHGLMIFAYNDEMVWSRAIRDTVGFQAFYDETAPSHRFDQEGDEPYFWDERARTLVVTVADSSLLDPAKASKLLQKSVKKDWPAARLEEKLRSAMKVDSTVANPLVVETELFEKGHQQMLKGSQWRPGFYDRAHGKGYKLLHVERILDPTLKSITEARGFYVNDYQNKLDNDLINRLRRKYNVVIHQQVIDEITY